MGVTYGNLRRTKNKTFSKKISYNNESININNFKRRISVRNSTSKIVNNFNDNESKNKKINFKSKSDKILETQNKDGTTTTASTNNEDIKNIKSLSFNNITKIEGGNHLSENIVVPEELNPNSIDTNSSSNASNREISNELLSSGINNDLDDNNSIDEEEEDIY